MKFSVSQGTFMRALATVSKGMASNSLMPIYASILITADGDHIELRSTDGTVSVRHEMPADVTEDGQVAVPGKTITGAVKNFPDGNITFVATDDGARMRCGRSSLKLNVITEEFPSFAEFEIENVFSMDADLLRAMAAVACKATSNDPSRPTLAGVQIAVSGGKVRTVATDTYRMVRTFGEVGGDAEFDVIVPGKTLTDVVALAPSGEVSIAYGESQVAFSFGCTTFITRRVVGSFPNCDQFFDHTYPLAVEVDAEELSKALKRVSVVTPKAGAVRLSLDGPALGVFAFTADGEANESVPIDPVDGSLVIGLSYQYLVDGVPPTGEVTMRLEAPEKPVVIESYGSVNSSYLLMPVRI